MASLIIFLLIVKLPFEYIFAFFLDHETGYYLHKIFFSIVIICLTLVFIKKNNFQRFVGIKNPTYSFIILYCFPLYLILLTDITHLKFLKIYQFLIPFLGIVFHAFAEELTFRGIILSILVRSNLHNVNHLKNSVLVSSVIFGLAHFVSLTRYDFISASSQVIYASILGIFFGALLVKGHNIYCLGLVHGIMNFISRINSLYNTQTTTPVYNEPSSPILTLVITFIIFSPILIADLYLLRRIKLKDADRLLSRIP